ncbi:MurT ligase domain-containing protein [Patescibacteria group bacterium]
MINYFLALQSAKLITLISKLIPSIGGTALPGLIALKLDPHFLSHFLAKHPIKPIVITGTNGKTTTSRLLSTILQTNQTLHIHNRTGSNLKRGVISTLISHHQLIKKNPQITAILEIDEAAVSTTIKELQPIIILFTNLFRDQLDRYGEINTILNTWKASLKYLPKSTKLILNIDDPSLNYLASFFKNQSNLVTFGLPTFLSTKSTPSHGADAIFCPKCLSPLSFSHVFTSHLSHYQCPKCHFKRLKPIYTFTKKPTTNLIGLHNLYNILAATSIAKILTIPSKTINQAIKNFKPAFGRGESFKLGQLTTNILLVKNPTGFNTTLETLKNKQLLNQHPLLLILNDLIADGTDVSWIWDVDFKYLKSRKKPIIVSGLRANDLALRLKIAGISQKQIIIQPNLKKALKTLSQQSPSPAHILPTYTAMLALREILRKQKIIHSTWKD